MEKKQKKMNISKKDVVFIIVFEICSYIFITMYINNTLSNCHNCPNPISDLDNIIFNVLLILPLFVMPMFFIFGVGEKTLKPSN